MRRAAAIVRRAGRQHAGAGDGGIWLRRADVHITVSIGLASLAEREEGFEVLLKRADEALYAAKDAGRNRVLTSDSV